MEIDKWRQDVSALSTDDAIDRWRDARLLELRPPTPALGQSRSGMRLWFWRAMLFMLFAVLLATAFALLTAFLAAPFAGWLSSVVVKLGYLASSPRADVATQVAILLAISAITGWTGVQCVILGHFGSQHPSKGNTQLWLSRASVYTLFIASPGAMMSFAVSPFGPFVMFAVVFGLCIIFCDGHKRPSY